MLFHGNDAGACSEDYAPEQALSFGGADLFIVAYALGVDLVAQIGQQPLSVSIGCRHFGAEVGEPLPQDTYRLAIGRPPGDDISGGSIGEPVSRLCRCPASGHAQDFGATFRGETGQAKRPERQQ